MALLIRRTTKLIEGDHRGLQDYRHTCYYFNVFFTFFAFFQNPKSRDFLRFLPCFVRFLELWLRSLSTVCFMTASMIRQSSTSRRTVVPTEYVWFIAASAVVLLSLNPSRSCCPSLFR